MDVKNLVIGFIALSLSAIMVGAFLVPVVAGIVGQKEVVTEEITNDGFLYISDLSDVPELHYVWDNTKLTANGVAIPFENAYPDFFEQLAVILHSDQLSIGYNQYGSSMHMRFQGNIIEFFNTFDLNITHDGDNYHIVGKCYTEDDTVGTDVNETVTNLVCLYPQSDTVLTNLPNVLVDTDLSGIYCYSVMGKANSYVIINGSIADGITLTVTTQDHEPTNVTASNVVIDYVDIPGFDDLKKINKITIDMTEGYGTRSYDFSFFAVPEHITVNYEKLTMEPVFISLYSLVPLIAVCGLVCAAIYVFISRK